MGMYKGIQAYTILCLKPALQYTIFEKVKATIVSHRRDGRLLAAEAFALGMVARTISTVFIYPFIRAKVVLQTSSCDLKGKSIPQMLLDMYNVDGVSSWFQGLGPELARGVLSSALMLMIKDQIGFIVKKAIATPKVDKATKLLRN
jgi:solute carrier family 25 (peroxisomal adenine nucleotide transporter), member 17